MSISLETLALAKKYTKNYVDSHGGGGGTSITYGSVSLSTSWTGNGPFTQIVSLSGYSATDKTKVDLLADSDTVAQMIADGVDEIYIENDDATLTAYAIGGKPSAAMTIQAVFSEVN